ncbi:hypothetical protein HAX54_035525 [Datura stramonium]|uniref:Uncharacterized protein n=1 Tax=Datura stramonium TaxID=4076 RepID=A0ABS8VHP8_DATST|nr:hypothetical protein [Datura stramonium]
MLFNCTERKLENLKRSSCLFILFFSGEIHRHCSYSVAVSVERKRNHVILASAETAIEVCIAETNKNSSLVKVRFFFCLLVKQEFLTDAQGSLLMGFGLKG